MKYLFYSPIRIAQQDPDRVFFWSDTHFGHRCENWDLPLWSARGFSTLEEHDGALLKRWNETVTPDSTAFHLGDFIFGANTITRFRDLVQEMNFETLYILPGNHCSGWKQNFNNQSGNVLRIRQNKKVIFVPNYVEAEFGKQLLVLSHYPLASFNGQARGSWMLHGHCHSNLYRNEMGCLLYQSKMIDVGVESCPAPVNVTFLKEFFEERKNLTFDYR